MNKFSISILIITLVGSINVVAQQKKPLKGVTKPSITKSILVNSTDSFSYAAGISIAESMKTQGVSNLNANVLARAINDVLNNKKTEMTKEQAGMTLQSKLQKFANEKKLVAQKKNTEFFNEVKKKAGIVVLPNGLCYEVLKTGDASGVKPGLEDTVMVNYVGKFTTGVEFDSNLKSGEPAKFSITRVIKGWTEILQLMSVGSKWRVYIPSELGYGERGYGASIPPNSPLVFEIELLNVLKHQ